MSFVTVVAAAVACVSGAGTTIGSLIIVADIANYPINSSNNVNPLIKGYTIYIMFSFQLGCQLLATSSM
jgi:hypothetical protein